MKSRLAILTAALAALTVAIFTPSASAQNARVNVPFDFVANHQVLPAGCYTVELQPNDFVYLVDCATGKVVGLMARTTNAYREVGQGALLFSDTIRGNRLTQIRFAHINMESNLAVQPKFEDVVAKSDASNTIEIAMR
jgi:hypothetical protein